MFHPHNKEENKKYLISKNNRTFIIVECYFDINLGENGGWVFKNFRTDKQKANHISVADNIKKSIKEGITKDEFTKICTETKQ